MATAEKETEGRVQRTEVPAGFTLKTVTTEADGVGYSVEVLQADSLQAILDLYKAEVPDRVPEDIVRDIWNAGNEQGAKQGPKEIVRKAVKEHGRGELVEEETGEVGEDGQPVTATIRLLPDAVTAAIDKAKEIAKLFVQGAPRAGGGGGPRHPTGLTKAQRLAFTDAIMKESQEKGFPSPTRAREIARELGIPEERLEDLF